MTIYGDRLGVALTDQQSCEEWIDTWGEVLGCLTGPEIKIGLAEVRRRVKRAVTEGRVEWPLSAVEFLALCQSRTLPAHRVIPRLYGPRVRSAVAEDCLRRMREMLE